MSNFFDKSVSKDEISLNVLLVFFSLIMFSGLFGYFSALYNLPILRLWKEVYLFVFFLVIFFIHFKNYNKFSYFYLGIVFLFILLFSLYSYSVNIPLKVIIYQLKLDGILIVFTALLSFLLKNINREQVNWLLKKFLIIILTLGVINSLFMIYQSMFFKDFLELIGLQYGNWGSSKGVKIITSGGNIRAIGFQLGFVPAGSLMLICFIFLIESKALMRFKPYLIGAMGILYLIGIYLSTYKTALIGLLGYLLFKLILNYKKYLTKMLFFYSTSLAFIFFFVSTHHYSIYKMISKFNEYYAYNSIYLRVEQHWKILESFNGLKEIFLGKGLGFNGTFGLNKYDLGMAPIPTDSTYIYLVSNYGFIVAIGFIFLLIILIYHILKNEEYDKLGIRYILVYLLSIEYFYNNSIVNFPVNLIIIFGVLIINKIILQERGKNLYQKKEIIINGRFLTQKITGVQRFALEYVKQLDDLIDKKGIENRLSIKIFIPKHDYLQEYNFNNIEISQKGRLSGHLWEQIELPYFSKGKFLINLCNTGPIMKENQMVVIHDVGVYGFPEAYSAKFRIWYKILYKFIAWKAIKIATVSNFSKKEILRYLKVPESKVLLLSEGKEHIKRLSADYTILEKHSLTSKKYILAVSSLNPNKNFSTIVKAVNKIKDNDFEIVIAGGNNSKVFKDFDKAELGEKVKFVGYVSDSELKALYENAACFIYPSFYEGFGLPPLEAMTCGTPVIVSNRSSLPELCEEAALYCNPEDAEDLSDKIKCLMEDNVMQLDMTNKGLIRSENFSWNTSASKLLDTILEDV